MYKALLTLLVGAATVLPLAREAQAQPPIARTVAFVDAVKFPPKTTQAHDRLRAALEDALAPTGWSLAQTGRPVADCGGSMGCMTKVAKDIGTNYVLRLSGTRTQDDGYDLTLELYQSATSRIQKSGAYCDYCDVQRITEVVSRSVVEILAGALKEESDMRDKAKQSAQLLPPPLAAPAQPPATLVTPPKIAEPERSSWMPWGVLAVGVLAMGYGEWMLHEDGQLSGSCSPNQSNVMCHRNSSKAIGIVGLVGGGVLATAAVLWVITTPSHSTTVSASPNHVALNVRF